MAWALVQSASGSTASATSVAATYASNVAARNKLIAAVAVHGSMAEDGSTPGAKTGTSTSATLTVTSNAFSPPAASMLVAIISLGHASGTPSLSVSDSGSHTWTQGASTVTGTNTGCAVFYTYLSSSPGSITVAAKNSTVQSQSMQLDVRVLNGAASSQAGAASNTATGTSTSWTGSLTTTKAGSWAYIAVAANAEEASITPNGNTSTLNNYQASAGTSALSGRQSAATGTGTPGATTFGWTSSSIAFSWAALEILPSITCTQVQDGSGNNWVALGAAANANNQTSLWALDTPAADAGTTPALTATFNVSAAGSIVIEEVSGLQAGATAAAMLDGTAATLTGTTQNPGSPSYTSTAASEYLICVYGDAGTSVTATQAGGWSIDASSVNTSANAGCCVEYKNSTSGAETDGWSTGAASTWALVEAAFKLASTAAVYTTPFLAAPGLFTTPAPPFPGCQPWAGDPSLVNFTPVAPGYISGTGVFAGQKTALGSAKGYTSGTSKTAAPANPQVVNQWAGSYGQGTTFTSISSAFQSCVIQLGAASSVGGGTGTPTAGNWLFTIASWTQDPSITTVHAGTGDDIHSWWRQYPASSSSGNVRTAISYTPNLARVPGYIYVAPDASVAAVTVLVVEVSGLGPWDTVAGTATASSAAATTLPMSLGAPGAASFFIGGIGGDSTAAGQAFAPAGYTTLHTVSQSNGTNQLASSYLTSAFLTSSSSSQSVSGTASSPTDLSGFILGVYTTGLSPVPANHNPAWPYTLFEAAFGSGYNTPDSEMTWTDLSTRLWDWDETTGIQFQLAQMQASNLTIEVDNLDAYLSPLNSASPYYPHVLPGTPVRIRFAMGTIGGSTVNRWYVIQRNAAQWDEEISPVFRRWCEVTGTDLWAALSATPPTFYRSEVLEDGPYAWWPCDDQPGNAGVLPAFLLNAAIGNTNVLNIVLSPNKGAIQPWYDTTGNSTVTANPGQGYPPSTGIYAAGADAGWMFGDPLSGVPSLTTGNSVSATPGSAAWQASGQAGRTGSYGWYLACNDAGFPPLSAGITVEIWFNAPFSEGVNGWAVFSNGGASRVINPITQQPYNTPITIWELATGSNPVCILQLNASGHLNLITYAGASATSHAIYAASDLRSGSWHMVTVTLTATTWQVWLDGGAGATVSGTAAGMTSAWTWFTANGDYGANGGSAAGTGLVHGGNIALSHIAVYPVQLPYYRVLDHYWAAISAFGQLPAPQQPQITWVNEQIPISNPSEVATQLVSNVFTPDGSAGGVGFYTPPFTGGYHAVNGVGLTAVVVATVPGGITSGPSAWAASATTYRESQPPVTYDLVWPWVTWTGLAPSFSLYTGSTLGSETHAAIVNGSGDSFTSGYGGGANGAGVCQTAAGNGSAPPAAGSSVGDTVGQRIERLMRAGLTTSPGRCIDPASLLVQAPGTQGGGIQSGAAIQAIQQSDSGMLFVDNLNNLTYWQRSHLAAQYSAPVWNIGPSGGKYPYYPEIKWITDPQRVWNDITIAPLSPTGASLPELTPQNPSGVLASQEQYGAQPYAVTSWLQSQAEMQSQANWVFATYGTPQRRAEQVKIDAAANPAMWPLVAGVNVGDVVTLEDWQIGGGGSVYTMRVTGIRRHFEFGSTADREGDVIATVWLQLDAEPSSYWT